MPGRQEKTSSGPFRATRLGTRDRLPPGRGGVPHNRHVKLSKTTLSVLIGLAASTVVLLVLGLKYGTEQDYWLVGVPTYLTAVGTVGLASATFILLRREDDDRKNTALALEHSAAIALEAARSRRDARARLIQINLVGDPRVLTDRLENGERVPPTEHTFFHLPADELRELTISQTVHIMSQDGREIEISPNGLELQNRETTIGRPMKVGNAETLVCAYSSTRTVAEWIRIYEMRQSGDPGDENIATVGVADGFDDGTIDTYEIRQGGVPLKPDPNLYGRWTIDTSPGLFGYPKFAVATYPLTRRYYVSKSRNEQLAEPATITNAPASEPSG